MTDNIKEQLREFKKEMQREKLKEIKPLRGEIWLADLGDGDGSVQGGVRPVLIIGNDKGNCYSTNVNCVPITTQEKAMLPTHFELINYGGLKDSVVLCEQPMTIDKGRLIEKKCSATSGIVRKLNEKMLIALGIEARITNHNFYGGYGK